MLSINSIHHVSLCVTDLERAKTFYKEVLRLEEIERPPFDFAGAWFAVGGGGQQLHLIVHPGETLRKSGIHTRDGHMAMGVQSYKEALAWLESCGVEYDARPHPRAGFPQIFILDPDRNIIELNSDICDVE